MNGARGRFVPAHPAPPECGVAEDQSNVVESGPVEPAALRLGLRLHNGFAGGLLQQKLEWLGLPGSEKSATRNGDCVVSLPIPTEIRI